jgi:hypothetical protein
LIEIGLLVLEKISKNFQCIFPLLLLSPLGQGRSPSFEQFRIPFPKHDLCQLWLEFKPTHGGSGEEVENVKDYRQTDYMDNRRSEKLI